MKWVVGSVLFVSGLLVLVSLKWDIFNQEPLFNPLGKFSQSIISKPLAKYSFEALSAATPQASQIKLQTILTQESNWTEYLFRFETENKQMTGQINVPLEATPAAGFPIVLMLRGYVDPAVYKTGMGTKNAAKVLAAQGFVTVAPDFLGYGGSDLPPNDVMAERLSKPKHVIDLIASLSSLPFVDVNKLGLWGHSNGGQIALSVLEITGKSFPTTLWAPVSKAFPYSILYYMDEAEDQGKGLRKTVADFETKYDVFDYSIDRYLNRIHSVIQIHQGRADDAVPWEWSQELADNLKTNGVIATLFTYPAADHNLQPDWNTVVARDVSFFNEQLSK